MPDCSRILYISSQMLCNFSSYAQKHACMSKSIATAHTYIQTECAYTPVGILRYLCIKTTPATLIISV